MSQEINEKRGGSLLTWLEGIKAEFHRVTWTGRQELLSYTKMVVLATFISGFAVFGVDYLLHKLLSLMGLAY
jgi:preprotein translocase subunit SecE